MDIYVTNGNVKLKLRSDDKEDALVANTNYHRDMSKKKNFN